jgi:3-isopropylmalate dehydrogenase
LFGAVGDPRTIIIRHCIASFSRCIKIKKRIGSFTNVRPIKTYPTLLNSSPLKQEIIDGIDFVVFRELTGGAYFSEKKLMKKAQKHLIY